MSGYCTVFDLGRTFTDRDGVLDLPALLSSSGGTPSPPHHPPGAQVGKEFLFQRASGLDEQGTVDGLMGYIHHLIIRILICQPTRDLLRRPVFL